MANNIQSFGLLFKIKTKQEKKYTKKLNK